MASLIPPVLPCAHTVGIEKAKAHSASEAVFKALQTKLNMENFS
jgi:hypothetical protein